MDGGGRGGLSGAKALTKTFRTKKKLMQLVGLILLLSLWKSWFDENFPRPKIPCYETLQSNEVS